MSHCQRLSVDTALFFVSTPRPPCSPLFPYTTLFRSLMTSVFTFILLTSTIVLAGRTGDIMLTLLLTGVAGSLSDRKSTRLNSSHVAISYAVFCLKKKIKPHRHRQRPTSTDPIHITKD